MSIWSRLFKNAEGKTSWTKLGGQLVAVSAAIVALPAGVVPVEVIFIAKMAICVGAAIGVSGARDALEKVGAKK